MPHQVFVNDNHKCKNCKNLFRRKLSFCLLCDYHPGFIGEENGFYSCCNRKRLSKGCEKRVHFSEEQEDIYASDFYLIEVGSEEYKFFIEPREITLEDCKWFEVSMTEICDSDWKLKKKGKEEQDVDLLEFVLSLDPNEDEGKVYERGDIYKDEEKYNLQLELISRNPEMNMAYNDTVDTSDEEDYSKKFENDSKKFIVLHLNTELSIFPSFDEG